MTRDPIKDGRNWYSYCENNPISYHDAAGLVKISVYWYGVLGLGNHMYIVIEDNVKGSPTEGKKWIISGYPIDPHTGKLRVDGFDSLLGGEVKPEASAYDRRRNNAGGIVLVDDNSPVEPWLKQANLATDLFSGTNEYHANAGDNSNTFMWYILWALGLQAQFDKAMNKREKAGYWKPWAPGIGIPTWRPSNLQPFPTYKDPALAGKP